jgi:hypothetical protein
MSYDEFKLLLDDITFRETHKFDAFPISSDECVLYNIDVHTTTFIDGDELFVPKIGRWIDMDGAETRGYGDKIIVVTDDWFFEFYKARKYDPFKDGKVKGVFSSLGDIRPFTVDTSVIIGGRSSSPYLTYIYSPRSTGMLSRVNTITSTSSTLNLRIDSNGRIIFT